MVRVSGPGSGLGSGPGSGLGIALVLGAVLGLGCWLVVSTLPRLGRPGLAARVAPHVADLSGPARELADRRTADPLPVLALLLAPPIRRLAAALDALLGGSATTERRLAQAGSTLTAPELRIRQLLWGAVGAGLGVLVDVLLAGTASGRPLPPLAQLGV
ncbi:MAG: hypothetical protein QM635_12185, partial [Microbacteriaceae bacterium]